MATISLVILAAIWMANEFATPVWAVDESKFMTCKQSAFCRRYKLYVDGELSDRSNNARNPRFVVNSSSVVLPTTNRLGRLSIENTLDQSLLFLTLQPTDQGFVRITIDESSPIRTRYRLPIDDILADTEIDQMAATSKGIQSFVTPQLNPERLIIQYSAVGTANYKLVVEFLPFRIDFFVNDDLAQSINGRYLLNFERYRTKPQAPSPPDEGEENEEADDPAAKKQRLDNNKTGPPEEIQAVAEEKEEENPHQIFPPLSRPVDAVALDEDGAWESYFGGETDVKPYGPSAVGIDCTFLKANHIFGLPAHATSLSIPEDNTPYRSWNLDVFEYNLNSPMSIYGSVPLIIGIHQPEHHKDQLYSTGLLWVNPAESWIMVEKHASGPSNVDTWFVAETGIIDFFLMAGPNPRDILVQYHRISGLPAAPPLFGIAKHQCRWNYKDEADIAAVDADFDEHEIPYDMIWLDIDHTDGRKYFTWDPVLFPTPEIMVGNLGKKGRKLVAIVDPHIKKQDSYSVYKKLKETDCLLKNPDMSADFEGWCWAGTSVYPDFLNAKVREIFGQFYLPEHWRGSSDDLFVWNDMNEPSVFNKPEMTCPRGTRHLDGREHREVHNLYSVSYQRATYEALLRRNNNQRPFVLGRAYFIGTHRYGAVWTGDNMAKWDHLRISTSMVLSSALGGISFTGADVGGFFGNPDAELMTRWAQFGIWYPFYRDHAHIESVRREPWLFPKETLDRIRVAARMRYRLLPQWYTTFMEYSLLGLPVVRPIWWDISAAVDPELFKFEDDELLMGDAFLVRCISSPMADLEKYSGPTAPVPKPCFTAAGAPCSEVADDVREVQVYLPRGANSRFNWFNYHTGCPVPSSSAVYTVPLTMNQIPVFIKSGSIVFTRSRARRSSFFQLQDPLTMDVYLRENSIGQNHASGKIFLDDGNTYGFRDSGAFAYDMFTAVTTKESILSVRSLPMKLAVRHGNEPVEGKPDLLTVNRDVEKVVVWGLTRRPEHVWIVKDGGEKIACQFYHDVIGCDNYIRLEIKNPLFRIGSHTTELQIDMTITKD